MNCIPKKLKDEMAHDPFYDKCCVSGETRKDTKIEWHHNFKYAGKQVQEKWCILPLKEEIHDNIVAHRDRCDWVMLNRASEEQLKRYSRAEDLIFKRERLNRIYGNALVGV